MPCNSDYLNPTYREEELQRAARLLIWLGKKVGKPISAEVKAAAQTIYCGYDSVPFLCQALKSLTVEEMESIVYNAHDKTARELATWWEEHRRADCKRVKAEGAA